MKQNTPTPSKKLNNWNGYGKKGEAAYDQHFEFEMSMADAEDIIRGHVDSTEEELETAYALVEKYR